jgi:ribosome-associated toxin RatA of RatAB toxin-antitoxin module
VIIRDHLIDLGPMPEGRRLRTVDERFVAARVEDIFELAANVEEWPLHLRHYRYVRMVERDRGDGGIVEMAANRPFGPLNWPTWWVSEMEIRRPPSAHAIRFRHVRGFTTGMEVEWSFAPEGSGTQVRIVHEWNGPRWPLIGAVAATMVIGPVFVHGIASRTLAGLARAAARST